MLKQLIKISMLMGLVGTSSLSFAESRVPDEIMKQLSLEAIYALPMIDIATGYAVPLEKAPAVATVITSDEIEAMGAETLDDILEAVPGLHNIPSFLSNNNSVSIRGVYTSFSPQVLTLINGYRLSSSVFSGGLINNYRINVKNIARVEIVRGPGSAVYGADAFSGVINIITKNAHELKGGEVGIGYGSDDFSNFWAQYGFHFDNGWHLATNIELAHKNADKSRKVNSDLQTTFDGIFGTSASLAPSYIDKRYKAITYGTQLYNGNWKLNIDGTIQRDNGNGFGVAQTLDHKGSSHLNQVLLGLEYKNKEWIDDIEFKTNLSLSYIDGNLELNLFPAGSTLLIGQDGNIDFNNGVPVTFSDGLIGTPGATNQVSQLETTFIYTGLDDHTVRFNIGMKHEQLKARNSANFGPSVLDNPVPLSVVDGRLTSTTGTSFSYVKDGSRVVKYLSLQDSWEITADWAITAGVRYDRYSDFGSTTNPRLALIWTPNSRITAKLLHGWAFRAPSFGELHAINNPVSLGNPNLEPETVKTTEFAFFWQILRKFTIETNLYYYKTENMIDYFPDATGNTSTAQNNQSLEGTGFEIAADWTLSEQWRIKTNYAYQKTIDQLTKEQQPYVPKQTAYLAVDWNFYPKWQLSSQLNWVADRERATGDPRKAIDDYALTNLSLNYQHQGWKMGVMVKNLFDQNVYEPSDGKIPDDYILNERGIFASIRYHFK